MQTPPSPPLKHLTLFRSENEPKSNFNVQIEHLPFDIPTTPPILNRLFPCLYFIQYPTQIDSQQYDDQPFLPVKI